MAPHLTCSNECSIVHGADVMETAACASASSTALLLTPTHLLMLCNCTNYWQCLTSARRLDTGTLSWLRT